MSRSLSKAVGEVLEDRVCDAREPLAAVDDSDADWHDARTTGPLSARADLRIADVSLVEPETLVEIKGCQFRIAHNGSTRRGHWLLKRRAHERLLDADGVYYLIVYRGAETPGDVELVHEHVVPAAVVDDSITTWTEVQSRSESHARVPWSRLVDPETVEGGDEA